MEVQALIFFVDIAKYQHEAVVAFFERRFADSLQNLTVLREMIPHGIILFLFLFLFFIFIIIILIKILFIILTKIFCGIYYF